MLGIVLPPTTPDLLREDARPYFAWWTDINVAQFRALLQDDDPEIRVYWLGVLLREANTRDVWLFVKPADIRAQWPALMRHLGRTRQMWAWLLDLPLAGWPPSEARGA
jgi:hypothetical protein